MIKITMALKHPCTHIHIYIYIHIFIPRCCHRTDNGNVSCERIRMTSWTPFSVYIGTEELGVKAEIPHEGWSTSRIDPE